MGRKQNRKSKGRSVSEAKIVIEDGAREPEVEEPLSGAKSILFEFEVEEVAEPKALSPGDLRDLILRFRSPEKAGAAVGVSEAFVRQNAKAKK